MAQTRRSTARGLEQVPRRRLSAVPAEEAASAAARRGKRRGRIKYRIFTLGLGLDMTMLFLILVLLAVGLVMMFSASYAYAYYYYGNSYYFILRQGMFALVGVVLMLAISTFDYHQLHKLNLPIFAVSILLLLMVLVFKGTSLAPNKGGAVRWLNLGFVEFQPSEIAKFALILMFAHLIALYGERMKTFRYGFLPFFGILGLICVLVIAEKHVSATIIIPAVSAAIIRSSVISAVSTAVIIIVSSTRIEDFYRLFIIIFPGTIIIRAAITIRFRRNDIAVFICLRRDHIAIFIRLRRDHIVVFICLRRDHIAVFICLRRDHIAVFIRLLLLCFFFRSFCLHPFYNCSRSSNCKRIRLIRAACTAFFRHRFRLTGCLCHLFRLRDLQQLLIRREHISRKKRGSCSNHTSDDKAAVSL